MRREVCKSLSHTYGAPHMCHVMLRMGQVKRVWCPVTCLHLGVQVEYFREIWITHMKLGWSPAQHHTDKPVPLGAWKGWLLHSIRLSVDTGRSKRKRLLILAGIRIVWERDTYHQTLKWQVSLFTRPENDSTTIETPTGHRARTTYSKWKWKEALKASSLN